MWRFRNNFPAGKLKKFTKLSFAGGFRGSLGISKPPSRGIRPNEKKWLSRVAPGVRRERAIACWNGGAMLHFWKWRYIPGERIKFASIWRIWDFPCWGTQFMAGESTLLLKRKRVVSSATSVASCVATGGDSSTNAGKPLVATAPLPDDFTKALAFFRHRGEPLD